MASSSDGLIVRWPVLSTRQTHLPVYDFSPLTSSREVSTPDRFMDETKSLPHSSCPTAPSRAVRTSKPCARPRAVFAADPPALVVNSPTRMRSRCRSSGPTRTLPPVSPSRDLKNESATLALWSMTARGCSATTSGGRFSSPPASRLRLRCGKRGDGTGRRTGVRYDSCVAFGRFRDPAGQIFG